MNIIYNYLLILYYVFGYLDLIKNIYIILVVVRDIFTKDQDNLGIYQQIS